MQKVAAYLLERCDGMDRPQSRAAEAQRLKSTVENWLLSKGGSAPGPSGSYQPEDGSTGSFATFEAADGESRWWMLQLQEDTQDGTRFTTSVSITSVHDRVSVYVTLETGVTTTHIVPLASDPRCPRVVRDLLTLPGRWYHGASTLRRPRRVIGFDDGEALASEIEHPERTVPLVVVSTDGGATALPDLDVKLGNDLAGLANIVVPDEDACWALTDALGAEFSCYRGAVRLFWPHFALRRDRYLHPLWTADRLQSASYTAFDVRDRFRKQLRGLLFRAAALSVVRPREIDQIRDAAGRRTIAELGQRATSLEEYQQLASIYATENDELRHERTALQSRVEELERELAKTEFEREALVAHLRAANRGPSNSDDGGDAELAPNSEVSDATTDPPASGETRYYKKVHAKPTHDIMVRVGDCGCNTWEGGHSGDKARKGIAKLEGGRADWKTVHHCASCTGGGMWRVRW